MRPVHSAPWRVPAWQPAFFRRMRSSGAMGEWCQYYVDDKQLWFKCDEMMSCDNEAAGCASDTYNVIFVASLLLNLIFVAKCCRCRKRCPRARQLRQLRLPHPRNTKMLLRGLVGMAMLSWFATKLLGDVMQYGWRTQRSLLIVWFLFIFLGFINNSFFLRVGNLNFEGLE